MRDFDVILFPLHLTRHWVALVMDVPARTVWVFDSMVGFYSPLTAVYIEGAKRWFQDESDARMGAGKGVQAGEWETVLVDGTQYLQQENGNDCGVFMLAAFAAVAGGVRFTHSQADMRYLRRKLALSVWEHRYTVRL